MKIIKAEETGFCFGVRRAIQMLEQGAFQYKNLETLGPVVHNEQVIRQLDALGVHVIKNLEEASQQVVAISSHGISPDADKLLRSRVSKVIDTTCPFVSRAQVAAKRFAEAGFFTIIFGESGHPEVQGILGYAKSLGLATLKSADIEKMKVLPRRLGFLSQTTQIPEKFNAFIKNILDVALQRDSEVRILDTICHDIRRRQLLSLELAEKVDMMLVVGGRSSANTHRLFELCSGKTETHMIETADEIDSLWLNKKSTVGVTSGTSTSDSSIEDVVRKLEYFSS